MLINVQLAHDQNTIELMKYFRLFASNLLIPSSFTHPLSEERFRTQLIVRQSLTCLFCAITKRAFLFLRFSSFLHGSSLCLRWRSWARDRERRWIVLKPSLRCTSKASLYYSVRLKFTYCSTSAHTLHTQHNNPHVYSRTYCMHSRTLSWAKKVMQLFRASFVSLFTLYTFCIRQ